jgi:hypothetical protein
MQVSRKTLINLQLWFSYWKKQLYNVNSWNDLHNLLEDEKLTHSKKQNDSLLLW